MKKGWLLNLVKLIKDARSSWRLSLTLQHRLFAFFILFLVAVMSGLLLVLFSVGVFSSGSQEANIFLENELSHIVANVTKETGTLSVEGVALAQRITEQSEKLMKDAGTSVQDLSGNSALLDTILQNATDLLLSALERNKCSGVFFVLDATTNPNIEGSDSSRSGVYFKNMEPNALNMTSPTVRYLRGPAFIARQYKYDMLPQWQMEFSVEPGDFFHNTISAAKGSGKDISRLYYWDPACTLRGDYERTVLLCVPIVMSDGSILGICGFEVSAMLFKLQNTPKNDVHNRVFAMWAPIEGLSLYSQCALFGGNHTITPVGDATFEAISQSNEFFNYETQDGLTYSGLHQKVNLYPKDSVHSDKEWAVSIMIPTEDLASYISARNRPIYLLLIALLAASICAALFISKRYIAPVVDALDKVKSGALEHEKTNIQEIDDLFAFLAERDSVVEELQITDKVENILYDEFVQNIKTLSPAERSVFNLYVEGYTAKEITEILCLSINTIKTHNKRIYQKLNVSSRKELLVFVDMMKDKDSKFDY